MIARILVDVGDVDGTPLAYRSADEAAGDGDAALGCVRVAKAPGVAGDQGFALVIEKHDAEHLVIDEAAEKLADAGEERIEVEDRGELGRDFIQDGERLRLAGDAGVEAGVLNGLRNARGGEGEQMQVLGAEVVGLLAFDVHDADEAIFCDEGNGELGADFGVGGEVIRIHGDIVEQDGLASARHLADDAFAERKAHALDFRRVADLKAHAEVVGAVVEKKNGEDAIGEDGTNQFRGADEERFEVEGGIERVGKLDEVGEIGGFNADVGGVQMRVGIGRIDRTIVAFEFSGFGGIGGICRHSVEGNDS